jgi:hypothetical protein
MFEAPFRVAQILGQLARTDDLNDALEAGRLAGWAATKAGYAWEMLSEEQQVGWLDDHADREWSISLEDCLRAARP